MKLRKQDIQVGHTYMATVDLPAEQRLGNGARREVMPVEVLEMLPYPIKGKVRTQYRVRNVETGSVYIFGSTQRFTDRL